MSTKNGKTVKDSRGRAVGVTKGVRGRRPGATMGDMGNLRDDLAEESKPRAGQSRGKR